MMKPPNTEMGGLSHSQINHARNSVPCRDNVTAYLYAISFCKQCQIPLTERYSTVLKDSRVLIIVTLL